MGTLRLPERFLSLKAEQQSGALTALQPVDTQLHQAVLDEWDARCQANTVRNPGGYLFGIIQKAMRSEFRAWAGQKTPSVTTTPESQPPESPPPADPTVALEHIARLRALMRLP